MTIFMFLLVVIFGFKQINEEHWIRGETPSRLNC